MRTNGASACGALEYESAATQWLGGAMPLTDRAVNIFEEFYSHEIGARPIIFICHSMGGLVVKKILQRALSERKTEWEAVGKNVRAVIFLSTPHFGAALASFLKALGGIFPLRLTPAPADLEKNADTLRELSDWYRDNAPVNNIATRAYCEKKATNGFLVVDETSANPFIANITVIPLDVNHFEAALPKTRTAQPYPGIRAFIRNLLPEPASAPALTAGALAGKKIVILYKRDVREDKYVCDLLEKALQDAGAEAFVDRQIPVGNVWRETIKERIISADAVIPLLSKTSITSEMLEEELLIANAAAETNEGRPRLLPVRIGYEGPLSEVMTIILSPLQYLLWESPVRDSSLTADLFRALTAPSVVRHDIPIGPLGSGTGAIPLDSQFYIERAADALTTQAIQRGEGVILLRGPRQVGKTSLLNRALDEASKRGEATVVRTDCQALTEAELKDLPSFYKALSFKLQRALRDIVALPSPTSVWDDGYSPNDNFEDYIRINTLKALPGTLIWGIDEVDRLFPTAFRSDVFGLFRSWYNARNSVANHPFQRLLMIFAYATEAWLFIDDLNQSPFNVGFNVSLQDFTQDELLDLNGRFGNPLLPGEMPRFTTLFGGHPFLTHRALVEIVGGKSSLEKLEQQADQDTGLFGDHLRRIQFSTESALLDVLSEIVRGRPAPDDRSFNRLCEAGILKGNDYRNPEFRCGIYRTYLTRHLLNRVLEKSG